MEWQTNQLLELNTLIETSARPDYDQGKLGKDIAKMVDTIVEEAIHVKSKQITSNLLR